MKLSALFSALILLILVSAPDGLGQDAFLATETKAIAAKQWEVCDLRFIANDLPQQPVDVDFYATFQHASGTQINVPGFYNGGNQYVIRFTPPTAGEWKYVTNSSLPTLNNQQGRVSTGPAVAGRKGGIKLDSQNKRNFRYESGKAYYPIAFECDWLFALDADNPEDIPVTRKFVDTLAENGFNQVVMNVFAYDVNWKKDNRLREEFEYGSPSVFPFGGTNTQPDHTTLNIEYFKRLDRVIKYLDDKGIAAHLMIYVWNKKVNWPDADSEADNRYFDYVVRRYQAYPNLVWDISKEALGYGHNDVSYITGRIERLRELDAFDRLITVHDYGYCKRFSGKVDFVSVQTWVSELNSVMRKIRSELPGKPILNIEHGGYERGPYVVFEGNYTSPAVCLERAYQCVFAGTYPTHYWQGAAWNVVIPDIDSLSSKDRPRLEYYRHLQTLVDKFDLANLSIGARHANSGFSLHDGKHLFLYYVPKENISIGIRLPKHLDGRMMHGTWFDPFTGEFSEPVRKKNVQWPKYAKPTGDQFAILILKVDSKNNQ